MVILVHVISHFLFVGVFINDRSILFVETATGNLKNNDKRAALIFF
jgi:hypothetical protein